VPCPLSNIDLNTVAACNIPQTTTRFPALGLGPAEILYQCFGLVCWHTADTQGSDLSPSSQPLESNSNFPAFGLGEDKDIFLAFLIANAGSENVDARQFSTLFQLSSVRVPGSVMVVAK
jgi:hypothetical protein